MDFTTSIDLFVQYMVGNNLSDKTVSKYSQELTYFFAFMNEKGVTQVEDIQLYHLDLYNAHLMEKGNSPATRSNKYSSLRKFFKFCVSRKYVKENPIESIDPIKVTEVDQKKREVLTIDETIELITKTAKHSRFKEKNTCILKIFLYCGVRVSELCDLKVENIDFKEKTLTVKGKGRKYRKTPLSDSIIKDIKEHLKTRPVDSPYLFTTKRTDQPMKPRAVHDLIKNHVSKTKIKKNIGCHSLRRTSATNYLRNGVSERYIQLYLGHENISTTTKYMNPETEEVMEQLRKNNAVEKKLKQAQRKSSRES